MWHRMLVNKQVGKNLRKFLTTLRFFLKDDFLCHLLGHPLVREGLHGECAAARRQASNVAGIAKKLYQRHICVNHPHIAMNPAVCNGPASGQQIRLNSTKS